MLERRPSRGRLLKAHTIVLAALLVLSIGAVARAESPRAGLDRAKQQLADLLFEEALASLDEALKGGTANRSETAEIHLLLGETLATLERADEATKQFRHSLSLDPRSALPDGSSPKITEPFERAKESLKGAKPLKVRHAVKSASPPRLVLVVIDDPTEIIAGVRARYRSASGSVSSTTASGTKTIDIQLPDGSDRIILTAIDEHGNELAHIGTSADPIVVGSGLGSKAVVPKPVQAEPPPGRSRGYTIAWIATGAAAVGLAAVGTYYGLSARSTVDDINALTADSNAVEFGTQVKPLEDDARREALIANVAFGAAGAAAIVTGLLIWKSPGKERSEPPGAAIAPMVSPRGGGVTASFRF